MQLLPVPSVYFFSHLCSSILPRQQPHPTSFSSLLLLLLLLIHPFSTSSPSSTTRSSSFILALRSSSFNLRVLLLVVLLQTMPNQTLHVVVCTCPLPLAPSFTRASQTSSVAPLSPCCVCARALTVGRHYCGRGLRVSHCSHCQSGAVTILT